jgi:hypothetical protein
MREMPSNARNVGRVSGRGAGRGAARVVQLTVTSYNVIQYSGCLGESTNCQPTTIIACDDSCKATSSALRW